MDGTIFSVISYRECSKAALLRGLLVIAINPFLTIMETIFNPSFEIVRAFADDLGMILGSLLQLKKVFSFFKLLEKCSELALKASNAI